MAALIATLGTKTRAGSENQRLRGQLFRLREERRPGGAAGLDGAARSRSSCRASGE